MPAAALGSAAIGAGASIFGSVSQANAAKAGIAAQQQLYGQGINYANQQLGAAQNTLNPFISAGQGALSQYQAALPGLTQPFNAGALPTTPGYEFTLNQGLKSTQNGFAAQGLASSGSALKGASAYSTGLAQNTYNQQFQNYLTQNSQIGNLLFQPAALGAGAASSLAGVEGSLGAAGLGASVQTGQGIASSLAGYGNALAGGAAGVSNSLTGGLNSALLYSALQNGALPNVNANALGGLSGLFSGGAGGAAYQNSTGGFLGMTDAQQDALQDAGFNLP